MRKCAYVRAWWLVYVVGLSTRMVGLCLKMVSPCAVAMRMFVRMRVRVCVTIGLCWKNGCPMSRCGWPI